MDIVLTVHPNGLVSLNAEERLARKELGPRLEAIFRTRVVRYAYVASDPNVTFADVVEVIEIAKQHLDYVSILTPSLITNVTYPPCLNPNLPPEYKPWLQ